MRKLHAPQRRPRIFRATRDILLERLSEEKVRKRGDCERVMYGIFIWKPSQLDGVVGVSADTTLGVYGLGISELTERWRSLCFCPGLFLQNDSMVVWAVDFSVRTLKTAVERRLTFNV